MSLCKRFSLTIVYEEQTKNTIVTFTIFSLFLGTGCLQNIASSGFPFPHNYNVKNIKSITEFAH